MAGDADCGRADDHGALRQATLGMLVSAGIELDAVPVSEDTGTAYLQFRSDRCLSFAPSVTAAGRLDGTWNWLLEPVEWGDPPPLETGTAVPGGEMLRVLREKADSARGAGGMTGREFCRAAMDAGAAEALMLPADGPGGFGLPAGKLPDGRGFVVTSSDGKGFPLAVFHVPALLRLQFYAADLEYGDFSEPDGENIYPEVSAEKALSMIRFRAGGSSVQDRIGPEGSSRDGRPGLRKRGAGRAAPLG